MEKYIVIYSKKVEPEVLPKQIFVMASSLIQAMLYAILQKDGQIPENKKILLETIQNKESKTFLNDEELLIAGIIITNTLGYIVFAAKMPENLEYHTCPMYIKPTLH